MIRRSLGLGTLPVLLLCGAAYAQAPATPPAPAAQAPAVVPTPPAADAAAKAAAAAKANIDVTDGWARATPGNAMNAAVYLRIVNVGKEADRLIGADVGAAEKAEIHTGAMQGGVMHMDPVTGLAIPAGGTVTLAPAGNHLMLIGLKAPLKEGESFLTTLNFEKAGKETVAVKITAANAMGPPAPARAGNPRDVTSGVSEAPAAPAKPPAK